MIVYDSIEYVYVGDELTPNTNCESYSNFYIVSLMDTAKWLGGDSSQLIKAYFTKCWNTEDELEPIDKPSLYCHEENYQ